MVHGGRAGRGGSHLFHIHRAAAMGGGAARVALHSGAHRASRLLYEFIYN